MGDDADDDRQEKVLASARQSIIDRNRWLIAAGCCSRFIAYSRFIAWMWPSARWRLARPLPSHWKIRLPDCAQREQHNLSAQLGSTTGLCGLPGPLYPEN